ncbi:MAG TPA: energy-coupled thiamine transporter ThiT [Halanaerobiaceae bacterium]|jgi:thiamine transporter|nr:energy-coupled thiamine transporter ThiT [Bacillota bacterium]HHU92774.1 energy-coupled thiamine transporter ThiT [Halanaerobiaceae bacterium]HOA40262.1 energy-coupled thiamine transporter ThiT [Halanaerobiales bacterium]HPZ62415.1 energy-coupled thiamine transporter ThiT [Halanaerobiales bacterium]HQD03813.1 energy-coupled thiamine transporter ThiT [Halanaerobiales bacterium]
MQNKRLRLMTEMGVAVALAAVLDFLTLFRMPQGGSVNLEMLPILIVALRWGGLAGMATGLVYGLLQLALNPYVVHPLQILLDYPLAYMLVGIAGFFSVRASDEVDRLYLRILPGVLLAGFGRFLAHLLTGVIFFSEYAPEGQNVWLYSTIYNGSYILPSILISYLIITPILRRLLIKNRV